MFRIGLKYYCSWPVIYKKFPNRLYNILIIIETFALHVISHLFLTRFKIDERKKLLVPVEIGKAEAGIRCSHLGIAYYDIAQFKTAIEYHQRALEIAKEVGDKAREGKVMAISAALIVV